jgi:peptidyl-prolyl cis-trans isomerase SurA
MAAPPVTPEEAAETKRIAMEAVSARIVGGEKFEDLVLDNSEDEATKESAGDLGYFSEMRMPPDFLAAVRGLRVGEVSKVVQTYLGFHIIQLLEIQPERQLSFEEAQEEISGLLSARKRAQAVVELTARVGREADFAQFVR